MKKYIQLRDYAKNHSVTYRTAWNRFNTGKIPNSFKDENNNILVEIFGILHNPQKQVDSSHPQKFTDNRIPLPLKVI